MAETNSRLAAKFYLRLRTSLTEVVFSPDRSSYAPTTDYFSSSRTCEIGLTHATGQVYRSYMYMIEAATRDTDHSAGEES